MLFSKDSKHLRGRRRLSLFPMLVTSSMLLPVEAVNVCGSLNYTGPIQKNYSIVTLEGGQSTYGLSLKVGEPPQTVAAQPHMGTDDTMIYDAVGDNPGDCLREVTSDQCIAGRGGFFDGRLGGFDMVTERPGEVIGLTTFEIGTNTTLTEMPIKVAKTRQGAVNGIGLTRNSSFLRRLKDGGFISSRSFSYWSGISSVEENRRRDGHVVLGGIDKGKTTGKSFTGDIRTGDASDCESGLILEIMEISMDLADGTSETVSDFNIPQPYCLLPGMRVMQMPRAVIDRYDEVMDIQFLEDYGTDNLKSSHGRMYRPSNVYNGGLSIKISNDFTVKISNEQLVVPPISYDNNGVFQWNTSFREVLVQGPEVRDTPRVGSPLLAAAMLSVDYDANTFTVHEMKPGDVNDQPQDLQPIISNGDTCEISNQNAPDDSTDNPGKSPGGDQAESASDVNSDENADNDEDAGGSRKVSGGAIAGAVVGSLAAVALIGALIFFLLRRRRNGANRDGARSEKNALVFGGDPDDSFSPPGAREYFNNSNGGNSQSRQQHRGPSTNRGLLAPTNSASPTDRVERGSPTLTYEPTYHSTSSDMAEMGPGRPTSTPYAYGGINPLASHQLNNAATLAMSQFNNRSQQQQQQQYHHQHQPTASQSKATIHEMESIPVHELFGHEIKANGERASIVPTKNYEQALPPPQPTLQPMSSPRYEEVHPEHGTIHPHFSPAEMEAHGAVAPPLSHATATTSSDGTVDSTTGHIPVSLPPAAAAPQHSRQSSEGEGKVSPLELNRSAADGLDKKPPSLRRGLGGTMASGLGRRGGSTGSFVPSPIVEPGKGPWSRRRR